MWFTGQYAQTWIIIAIAVIITITGIYSFIEPFRIEIKKTELISNNIPEGFSGARIIFIADIHCGFFFSQKRVSKIVEKINSLKPDIMLLGGDYVDYISGSSSYIKPCFDELKKISAPLGVYGVLGNHDHAVSADLTRKSMTNAGIVILDNTAIWINKKNQRIKIGGVGDMTEDSQEINPTIKDASDKDLVILLSHDPDYFEHMEKGKVDLVLSGHSHGGQVTLFGLWAPLMPSRYGQKYRTGIIENEKSKLMITNGVGTATLPVRFFARPQINIIELKRKDVSHMQAR